MICCSGCFLAVQMENECFWDELLVECFYLPSLDVVSLLVTKIIPFINKH